MSHQNETEGQIKIGITCGDINGVGLEVIMKTFMDSRMHQVCTPVIYASNKLVSLHRKHLGLNEFQYQTVRSSSEVILRKTNLVNCWDDEIPVEFGKATEQSGKYAFHSLEAARNDLKEGRIDAIVTAPINKNAIQGKDFQFAGHTEYFAHHFGVKDPLMFLVNDALKVAVVAGHVPIKDVSAHLSIDKIISKLKTMQQSLRRDFGVRKPRIAVLGLNPHAGDNGLIGKEELEIIQPAIKKCFDEGMFVYGPYPADGFFGSGTYHKFDAVLAMYHDQGLAPFKALSFSSGVNFTAGLPVVRTSPDHGTAYDIAGKGTASEDSFRDAIYLAIDVLRKREEFDRINANPLPFGKQSKERE
jgi:4-hydroxythreonine-4-phosphate dehydrogenase